MVMQKSLFEHEMPIQPLSWETQEAIHKRRYTKAWQDISSTAITLGSDVASALAVEIEELSTQHHEFRSGIQRAFVRLLIASQKREERVVLFDEAIPGFTLMLFKKDPAAPCWVASAEAVVFEMEQKKSKSDKLKKSPSIRSETPSVHSVESVAASKMIHQFFLRTLSKVLSVETDDAVFLFFPVSDLRKNLREMGYYFTD